MLYVVEHCHVITHPKFLAAGVHGRDLWEWGMKWSGLHETDGEIPMVAVLASTHGYGGQRNIKAAEKLVEVGLWERTDSGFRSLKWTEMGNKTKAQLEVVREKERAKKREQRKSDPPPLPSCPQGTEHGTPEGTPLGSPEGVLNSLSTKRVNSLGRDSEGESARGGAKRELRPDEPFTETRAAYVETLHTNEGIRLDGPKVWAKFVNDRISRGILFGSHEQVDAAWRKWAGDAVEFAKKDMARERERRERNAERFKDHTPKHEKETPEQAKKFAEQLAARVRAQREAEKAKGAA